MYMIFEKDPDAKLDYTWDWTDWLGIDTIDTFSFDVPQGITLLDTPAPEIVDDIKVKAWFEGGTANAVYPVVCKIVTVNGREEDKTAIFKMKPK